MQIHYCRLLTAYCRLLTAYGVLTVGVQAHDAGLSLVELRLEKGGLAAHLTFARSEIEALTAMDADRDGQVTSAEFAAAQPRLQELALEALEVRFDGHHVPAKEVAVQADNSNALHFQISFPPGGSRLSLRSAILANLDRGHRQYLSLRDGRGNIRAERMLDANRNAFEIGLAELAASEAEPNSFQHFLVLGVEHILRGYDHLAFLLALLLAGSSFGATAKIITSFTLAHSITLALATLDLIQISPRVVEPLIAISIVYVGLENLCRSDLKWRWLLTFAFGLAHGFGFASVLRDLGIGPRGQGVTVPLLSFNMGVELGQMAIAGLILPIIWKLRSQPSFVTRYVPGCSLLITLAGGYWLIERTLLE